MPLQGWNQLLNSGAPWQTTVGSPLSTASTATISSQAAGVTPAAGKGTHMVVVRPRR